MWTLFKKELEKIYWKEPHMFWAKGYFACSIGKGADYEIIQKYIKNQG